MSVKEFVQNNMIWVPQPPKDLNGLSPAGSYQFANMKNFAHATIFWMFGNLAADATIAIEQAKNIGGGSKKALTIPKLYRQACTAGDNKQQTLMILDSQSVASRVVVNTAPAEDNYLFAAEIEAEQLDVQNGFDCIRPTFVGGSGASLAAIFVVFSNARFQGDLSVPNLFPSVLAGEQEVIGKQ